MNVRLERQSRGTVLAVQTQPGARRRHDTFCAGGKLLEEVDLNDFELHRAGRNFDFDPLSHLFAD